MIVLVILDPSPLLSVLTGTLRAKDDPDASKCQVPPFKNPKLYCIAAGCSGAPYRSWRWDAIWGRWAPGTPVRQWVSAELPLDRGVVRAKPAVLYLLNIH